MTISRALALLAIGIAGCAALPGDADRGRQVFVEREQGHCILCHAAPGVPVAGNVGPSLSGVGARLTREEIRIRVEDITRVKPDAAMPAYRRGSELRRVAPGYRGQPILSARQVDDVVAWLATLR